MTEIFEIGRVVNVQGLKGEVRVLPSTDDPTRFERLATADITLDGRQLALPIERVWQRPPFVILKLAGYDSREAAEGLRGGVITVTRAQALPLSADEYYVADLIGLRVATEDGEALGEIADVITTGANDVYRIHNRDTGEEILLPAIKQCVVSVDVAGGAVVARLLPGLRGNGR